jgi:broad specificity phosphatase PhoE
MTSQVLPLWRDGDVIVLVRHEERCDRSTNPCLGPVEGVTVNGSQHAENLGKAFKSLGMDGTDTLASPAIRTAQTARFMFGKTELTASEDAVCGAAMGEELLSHKQPGQLGLYHPQRLHRRLRKSPGLPPCEVLRVRQFAVRAGLAQR